MSQLKIEKFRDFMGKVGKADFVSFSSFFHSGFFSWIAIIGLALIATVLTTVSVQNIPTNLKEGMIAARNIKADRNYEIIDEEATQKFKNDAIAGILPFYDLDEKTAGSIIKRIHDAFLQARTRYDQLVVSEPRKKGVSQNGLTDQENRELQAIFLEKLGLAITQTQWDILKSERFSERVESLISGIIRKSMIRPIVADKTQLDPQKTKGIILRKLRTETGSVTGTEPQYDESTITDLNLILSVEEARKRVSETSVPSFGLRNPETPRTITALAELLIEPNCALAIAETEKRASDSALNVKSVILKVNAGEMIIREGSRFEPSHLKIIHGIQKEKKRGTYFYEFLGTFLLTLLFIILPFYLTERFFSRVKASRGDHFLMAIIGLSMILVIRISLLMAPAIHDSLFFNISSSSMIYAFPVAGAAMLIRMFLGAEITLIFAVVISAIGGFFVETDIWFVIYCLLTNLIAIIAITNADKRSLIIRAGLITGIVGAITVLAIKLVGVASATEPVTVVEVLYVMFFALISGVGSSIFAMIVAPIVESVSGYTSDIKLLELANLNHPLLRELIVRAPGTYHHSHMVGILGEAAAESIGANALLVRVAAYYHDIGKMKKPFYFIENSKTGENKHDKLSPHMSALIIAAHIKDGIEMAEKASIPKSIIRMIPEHQGTRLISYFYEKAKTSEENVDEKDFVYPGPKPQTREAAILMLADAAEAAVRALKERSSARIQQVVQRVITDIFMEKQLDECELTLKDLNEIARSFVRILLGIYHSRIEYPKESDIEKPEISIVDENLTSESEPSKQPPQDPSEPKKS